MLSLQIPHTKPSRELDPSNFGSRNVLRGIVAVPRIRRLIHLPFEINGEDGNAPL